MSNSAPFAPNSGDASLGIPWEEAGKVLCPVPRRPPQAPLCRKISAHEIRWAASLVLALGRAEVNGGSL